MKQTVWGGVLAWLWIGFAPLLCGGCGGPVLDNFLAPLNTSSGGQVSISLVNDTPYRAIVYLCGYNPLDPTWDGYGTLAPSGTWVQKLVLEANETQDGPMPCFRRIELGGLSLRQAVELARPEGVSDEEIADTDLWQGVGFSDLPEDDPDPEQPTVGVADPARFLLGPDFSCGDEVIVRLALVAGTTNQFTITIEHPAEEE